MAVFFENLNFYFMKMPNIPVCGNIAVYSNKYCAVCLKKDWDCMGSRCAFRPLYREDTDKSTLTFTWNAFIIIISLWGILTQLVLTIKVCQHHIFIVGARQYVHSIHREPRRSTVLCVWFITLYTTGTTDIIQHYRTILVPRTQQTPRRVHTHGRKCTS